jgi:hypothetical protein
LPHRLLLVCAAVFALGVSTSAAAAQSPLAGDWKLNEGSGTRIADSSGLGNDGVLSGPVAWVPGMSGSALQFNGVSGAIDVPDSPSLEPATAVTVSAWVQAGASPGRARYILAKGGNGCVASSYGLYTGPHGGLQFYVSQRHGATYRGSPDASTGIWDGEWHHVIGSFDGTTVRLYVDGAQVGSGTPFPGSVSYGLATSNALVIGNYPGCNRPRTFAGTIGEVEVFDQALTPTQVQAVTPVQNPGSPSNPTGGSGSGGSSSGGSSPGHSGGSGSGPSSPGDSGGGTEGSTGPSGTSAPGISGLKLSVSTLTIGVGGHLVTAKGHPGARISYTANQSGQVRIRLLRSETGVRRRSRCVRATGRHAPRARCSLFVLIDSYTRSDRAGRTTLKVAGLVRRRLTPGRYRLEVTPRADGWTGRTVSVGFWVRRVAR